MFGIFIKVAYAGVPEWSKGQGLGPCDVGLRAFESLLLHFYH